MSKTCGAKTCSGSRCQHQAGHGTDHVGTGKCRLHGGASKGAPKGNKNAQKHGIYASVFSVQELDASKAMQGSVEIELAIARIHLMHLLHKQIAIIDATKAKDGQHQDDFSHFTDSELDSAILEVFK